MCSYLEQIHSWPLVFIIILWISFIFILVDARLCNDISFLFSNFFLVAPGKIVISSGILKKCLVQSLSCVWLFVTSWTAACQASLSITNSQSLLKLMSIESVVSSNHLILCCPLSSCLKSFPAWGSFQMSQFFVSGGQSFGVSASTSDLPMNTQDWSPLGWTGWISLQSKGLSRVFSSTTGQKHQFFGAQLSLWSKSHFCTWPLEKL